MTTTLLERAIHKARSLPEDLQDELAELILQAVDGAQPEAELTIEEEAAIMLSREAAARGEFATPEHMRATWAKYGQ